MDNQSTAETRTFSSDLLWVTLSQGLNFLFIGVVTLPAIAKSYPTEIYGVWVQASLTATWLAPVLNLQFGRAIVRFLAAEDDIPKRRQALGAMLWPQLVLAIVAVAVLVPLNKDVSSLLFASPQYAPFVQLVLLSSSFLSIRYEASEQHGQARSPGFASMQSVPTKRPYST